VYKNTPPSTAESGAHAGLKVVELFSVMLATGCWSPVWDLEGDKLGWARRFWLCLHSPAFEDPDACAVFRVLLAPVSGKIREPGPSIGRS
jgi:hypothetical protein